MFTLPVVCTDHLCRSPTAHGIRRRLRIELALADRVRVDSAATRALHITHEDFARADRILVMGWRDVRDSHRSG